MIGLDTNVVIRYLTQDDPVQALAATRVVDSLTEEDPGFISIVAVVEIAWVLRRSYGVDRESLATTLEGLLDARELIIQEAESVRTAVRALSEGGEFPDAVLADLGRRAGCRQTMTFDRRAAERVGMTLIETNSGDPVRP